jgi:hypothetical protein
MFFSQIMFLMGIHIVSRPVKLTGSHRFKPHMI